MTIHIAPAAAPVDTDAAGTLSAVLTPELRRQMVADHNAGARVQTWCATIERVALLAGAAVIVIVLALR